MRRIVLYFTVLLSVCTFAEVQIVDGKKYECHDGVCMLVDDEGPILEDSSAADLPRIAQGFMRAEEFIAFLENKEVNPLGDGGLWLTLFLVLLGGLAMNLTPCVLPMIPINLMIIGKSARRGVAYGLGIALAYGVLGVGAAIGGLAFGDIQGSPWFNVGVMILFIVLALALLDVFFIDFSRLRPRQTQHSGWGIVFAFGMGALSAVLAGACVAPILIAVLLLTADLFAKGYVVSLGLPFVLGLGMALPWPFLGAGLKILPNPGGWMKWINRTFGIVVLGFAAWYGWLAWMGFNRGNEASETGQMNVVPATFEKSFSAVRRPVLVDCWASWCKNCSAMERVINEPKVKKALEPFTIIRMQAEDLSKLREVKGFEKIKGLPAFVIFE